MRNLIGASHATVHLNLPPAFGLAKFTANDEEKKLIYIAGTGLHIACIGADDSAVRWTRDLRPLAEEAGCILPDVVSFSSFTFAADQEALCVGLSSGHLFMVHAGPTVEEVGEVEGGVVAMAWSPDGDAVAVLGGQGQLLLMTSTWDLLCEIPVSNNDPAFPQPTAPPSAPLLQQEEGAGENSLVMMDHIFDKTSATLCWRGDGKYFATCTVDSPGQAPRVRVWDRESGELHALGETAPGLLSAMDWQPNNRHLFVAQTRPHLLEKESKNTEIGTGNGASTGTATATKEEEASEGPRGAQGQAPEVRHVGAWKRELRRREEAAKAAGVAASPNHIIMYERNGLQHGGFDVPGKGEIESLCWSPDSRLLAVVLKSAGSGSGSSSGGAMSDCIDCDASNDSIRGESRSLQLWYRFNWHWYLKHERHFTDCAGLSVFWEQGSGDSASGLRVVTAEGVLTKTLFTWECCISALGTAAVIDGRNILLTPLRLGVVPPPMCSVSVALPSPAVAVALRQSSEDEALAAVLADGSLAVVESCEADLWEESLEDQLESQEWNEPGNPKLIPRILGLISPLHAALSSLVAGNEEAEEGISDSSTPGSGDGTIDGHVRQAIWVAQSVLLLLVSSASSNGGDVLVEVDVLGGDSNQAEVLAVTPSPAPSGAAIIRLVPRSINEQGAIIEVEGGIIYGYHCGGQIEELMHERLPTTCHRIAMSPLVTGVDAPLGLTPSGELYWGNRLVAREVTSFIVRHTGPGGAFLLFTTRAHVMITLSLASIAAGQAPTPGALSQQVAQLHQPVWPPRADAKSVNIRVVEENAMLVAAPADDVVAVYQAPRGNLEAVRPRALVLPAVAAALDAEDFTAAWKLATVNRLDLNVLADYKWPRFVSQAGAFLETIGSDLDAADFLATLTPGSVAGEGGLYTSSLGAAVTHHATNKKVEACHAVRAAIQDEGEESLQRGAWLRTELTSYSQCGDLEGALLRVKEVKDAEMQHQNNNGGENGAHGVGMSATAEQGLKHLLVHASEEEVYQAALGLYELELAYMVVAHSQRDPGEYLLDLQRFAAITCPHLRRHAIDLHLRRYDGAVRHLLVAGEDHHLEALALARQHSLLRLLIRLSADIPTLRSAAQLAAGEELEKSGRHEDAALAFVAAGDLERGLRAYRLAGQWRPALALAARLGRDPERVRAMAARLASDLEDSHRHSEAAAVTLEYLEDVPSAVQLLAAAGDWRECLRVAYARGRGDLVESTISPLAAGAAVRILENVTEDVERVDKYWSRLKELRGRREAMTAMVEAAEEEAGLEAARDADVETEAESMVSGLSIYTAGTAAGTTMMGGSGTGSIVSTVGGRKKTKKKASKSSKSRKIRQGSPEEEAQLARHILSLAPVPAVCSEVGQLTELLVMLGHEVDAEVLQRKLKALIDAQTTAVQDVLTNPPPGEGLVIGQAAMQMAAGSSGGGPGGGAAAVRALETAAAAVAGPELQRRAAESEMGLRGVHWKWDVLRDPY